MDNITTGDETEEGREEQIQQVVAIMDNVKFSLQHMTRSRQKPGDKASTDDESTKILGYKWLTELDLFAPGLSELNMNKKVREGKTPNESPVSTYDEASHFF